MSGDALCSGNRYKPLWVASVQSGMGGMQPCSSVGNCAQRDLFLEIRSLCQQGQLDGALDVLVRMDQGSTVPSVNVYSLLLKVSAQRKALLQAKRVHAHLAKHGLESTRFLGEYVVSTLVKCGDLEDALQVFHRLQHRSVFSWTAVISGYTSTGQGREALRTYKWMQEEGVQPDAYTIVSLLKACSSIADLEEGKRIHAEALKYRYEADLFVRTSLVDMYGKCGSIVDAQKVFNGSSQRDLVAWNAMLTAYVEQAQPHKVLELYDDMLTEGVSTDARTFVSILQACGMLAEKEESVVVDGQSLKAKSLKLGKSLHADVARKRLDSNIFVGNTLVSMYGKCGSILDVQTAFDGLSHCDMVTWNAMLAAYVEQHQTARALELYEQMQQEGIRPNDRTVVSMLQACGMLAEEEEGLVVGGQPTKVKALVLGKIIHSEFYRGGNDSHIFVGNTLVSMYGKCGSIVDAWNVFVDLSCVDAVSWNAMLAAYVEQGQEDQAFHSFEQMQEDGVSPNHLTSVILLQACGMLAEKEETVNVDGLSARINALECGKVLHANAWWTGHVLDIFVCNTTISMYGKCGSILDANHMFQSLSHRDVVAWTAIMVAYIDHQQPEEALQLYEQMREEGVSPNARTFVSTLLACGMLAEKEQYLMVNGRPTKSKSLDYGKAIHADIANKGYDSDVFVGNTLISMYGKCGSIVDARNVFDRLSHQSVVSANAMLVAYVEQDQNDEALNLYRQMVLDGASLDEVTMVSVFQACTNTASLGMLRQIHKSLVTADKWSTFLANTLISAYGKCASMMDCQAVFDRLPQPDVVSWNALIASYARQGDCTATLQCFEKMHATGVNPNGVTYLSLLSACNHAGLVDQGVKYFESMSRKHGITPEIEHYGSMADLLGRGGCFKAVEELLSAMPMEPDLTMWLCLLGACRKHGKVILGEQAFNRAVCLQPKHAAAYIMMANIYADAGLSDRAKNVRQLSEKEGAWKNPGQSWIEHEQAVHSFLVEDGTHPQQKQLYDLVEEAISKLKMEGEGIPDTLCIEESQQDTMVSACIPSLLLTQPVPMVRNTHMCRLLPTSEDIRCGYGSKLNHSKRREMCSWELLLRAF